MRRRPSAAYARSGWSVLRRRYARSTYQRRLVQHVVLEQRHTTHREREDDPARDAPEEERGDPPGRLTTRSRHQHCSYVLEHVLRRAAAGQSRVPQTAAKYVHGAHVSLGGRPVNGSARCGAERSVHQRRRAESRHGIRVQQTTAIAHRPAPSPAVGRTRAAT